MAGTWSETLDEYILTPQEAVEYIGGAGNAIIVAADDAREDVKAAIGSAASALPNAAAAAATAYVGASAATVVAGGLVAGGLYVTRDSWLPAVRKMLGI